MVAKSHVGVAPREARVPAAHEKALLSSEQPRRVAFTPRVVFAPQTCAISAPPSVPAAHPAPLSGWTLPELEAGTCSLIAGSISALRAVGGLHVERLWLLRNAITIDQAEAEMCAWSLAFCASIVICRIH